MSDSRLLAFGGAPLIGDRWVYALYLDETGIGKLAQEPLLIVAGVLIHADTQWRAISEHLKKLLVEATPAGEPIPSFLHATDIYAGRREFPKDRWSEDVRFGLLDSLADTPWKFGVPVVWGACDRRTIARESPADPAIQHLIDSYSVSSMICFLQAEWYMRNRVPDGQLVSVTLEQNSELQKRIKEIYHAAGMKSILDQTADDPETVKELLPLTRIIDAPTFQDKSCSSILQLADYCAWALKRASGRSANHKRFAGPLARTALTWNPGQKPLISAPIWGWSSDRPAVRVFLGRHP